MKVKNASTEKRHNQKSVEVVRDALREAAPGKRMHSWTMDFAVAMLGELVELKKGMKLITHPDELKEEQSYWVKSKKHPELPAAVLRCNTVHNVKDMNGMKYLGTGRIFAHEMDMTPGELFRDWFVLGPVPEPKEEDFVG